MPGIIKVYSEFNQKESETLVLIKFKGNLKNEYTLSEQDFFCFCALVIKNKITNLLTKSQEELIYKEGILIDEVRFLVIKYKLLNDENLTDEELLFYLSFKRVKFNSRKVIIKKEIARTNFKEKELNQINYKNLYYRELLKLTKFSEDLTLIDWYIPIVLKFDRLIHIFVKHVEETKFANGFFKNRTFFSYKSEEIITLLKTIIKREENSIKEHFVINSVMKLVGKSNMMNNYHRSWKNPICFDNEIFHLLIDKDGFIMTFYQV